MSPTSRLSNAGVVNSALWGASASLISAPILIVATVLVARILGVADFGRFAYYSYVVVLLSVLGDLGVGSALIRGGALAAGQGDDESLMRFVRAGTTWSLLQIPWTIFVGWLVLPSPAAQVLYALAMVAGLAFLGPSHYLVMTSTLRWASQVKLMSVVVSTTSMLAAAVLTGNPAVTFAAGILGTHLLSAVQIGALPRGRRLASLRPGRMHLSLHDLGFGFGSILHAQLNGFVFSRSEVLFFTSSQGRALGTFASAQTIAARATLLIDVFFGPLPTALTSAHGRGADTLRRAFDRMSEAVGLLFACLAPLLAVLVVTLAPVLFGNEFSGIAAPALILALCSLAQSSMIPVLALRFAQRSIMPMIVAGLFAAALDVALAATLVPSMGVAGAVIANASSSILYLLIALMSYLPQPEWRRSIAAHARRTGSPLVLAGIVSAPLLGLSPAAGFLLGLPLGAVASVALVRSPGVRISDDSLVALLEALPARLRRPMNTGMGHLLGRKY